MFHRGEIDWKIKRNKIARYWVPLRSESGGGTQFLRRAAQTARAGERQPQRRDRGGRRKGPGREPPGSNRAGGKCSRYTALHHDGLSRAGGHSARALARRAGEARRLVPHRRRLHRYRPERLDGSTSRGPRGRGGNGLGAAPRPEVARPGSRCTSQLLDVG